MRKRKYAVIAIVWLSALLLGGYAVPGASSIAADSQERTGVTAHEILIGSGLALTGKISGRGNGITNGAKAYIDYINDSGGVNGRRIKLVTCDDAYDPQKAIECFNSTLKDRCFAGCFFVGSATAVKYSRMADAAAFPMFGYTAGTPVLYENHPTQFILRASYEDEVDELVKQLWSHGFRKIALVYQNDAFGAAVRRSLLAQLQMHGAVPVVEASYTRLTGEVEDALKKIDASGAQAVVMGLASDGVKELALRRRQAKSKNLALSLSVQTDELLSTKEAAEGAVASEVVPSFDDSCEPAALYHKVMKKYVPSAPLSVSSYEGFINAMVLVEGLKRAGTDLTRSKFIAAMESMHDIDLGFGQRYTLRFTDKHHIGWLSNSVRLNIIRGGKLMPLTETVWKQISPGA
jgi:ABC-type branched-subunit amino acid transport system substrate-binding protein